MKQKEEKSPLLQQFAAQLPTESHLSPKALQTLKGGDGEVLPPPPIIIDDVVPGRP